MDFSDLPFDVINGCIAKYLLGDKKINKIFHDQEDNELKYLLFGEIKKLPYIIRCDTNTYKIQMMYLKHI